MFKKILITFMLFGFVTANTDMVYTANNNNETDIIGVVDVNTFNEYKFRITNEFLNFKNKFKVNGEINKNSAKKILDLSKQGLNYLPDSLSNKNYYTELKTSIEKGLKYPRNTSNYESISKNIENFLYKTRIQKVSGKVESFPSTGNAPLTVTLRGNVKDPTGTKLENYNYTWWINEGGKRKVIGNKISLTYVFKEEGNFSVFLDVKSNHKNSKGFNDVLPFSSRADIVVKEKIASLIVKVNSESLRQKEELKFTPEEARYGLLFDATSSTPTDGAKFTKTEWDFGNGVERTYDGSPRVERVKFAGEGDFTVKLKLRTNENKTVERKFTLRIHNPIATIDASNEDGYLGDKFTFNANNSAKDDDLTYNWEIVDLINDKVIFTKNTKTFTYKFTSKGKYNVKLYVTEPSGDTDLDYKIIYINSRAPEAVLNTTIPFSHKPNTVFLDASKSYDPDFSDDGKLKYEWIINGERVNLEKPNFNGSNGYYTFDSIGEQSVVVEVTDPDKIASQKKEKVKIDSILSVEFFAFPRVVQREKNVRLVSDSPEAKFYEWNFGDGIIKGGRDENITHSFKRSGIYNVKLKVVDENDKENTFSKNIFVGESDSPYAYINIKNQQGNVGYERGVCNGNDAYIVNRVDSITFSGDESIDITGLNTGISYSWKLQDSLYNTQNFNKKFDELGCFPVKLTVKSDSNGRESTKVVYVKVKNLKPTLSSLDVKVKDYDTDPVIVDLTALGAKDKDGVIQSYLWYYYTDLDSEPQDFRATRTPNTSFVLPKISGNYYFVVVMKDNNEARVNSEEANDSKYFITLTGDNVNTPIVSLSVDDNSVSIGGEVVFSAKVENILGQKITKNVSYKWDFDGDGFYDRETKNPTVSHIYKSSGEKHAKVKVKYKGFSNTKSVNISVANVLRPDFEYISVGSTMTFMDNSTGAGAKYEWDMGDGNIVKDKKSFTYKYEDGKTTHLVTLKLTEGTKTKKTIKKVVKNVSNFIKARKGGLVLFTNPEHKDGEILLENNAESVYLYMGASAGNIKNYVADFDIEYDSDLNGGEDDDEDNKTKKSYTSGEAILVELNNKNIQNVRVYLKDETGEIISSEDIKIVKNYIKESDIDVNSIQFEGVSDSIKVKLDRLKEEVGNFPKEHKLKGLMYVQRLKEEWNDNREKTNIILEFEGFIAESNISNGNELIDLLESLLVDGENDQSEKAIAYTALKNLIPKNIVCSEDTILAEGQSCYEYLIANLDLIKVNSNIDENRELGSQILKNIASDNTMSVKQKTDFKAILNTFVYGGLANIPEDEKKDEIKPEVIENTDDSNGDSGILNIVLGLLKIIFIIILIFCGIIGLFYLFYLISNKDKNLGFSDFIILKTSGKSNKTEIDNSDDDLDILNDIEEDKDIFEENKINDIKEDRKQEPKVEEKNNFKEPKKEVIKENKTNDSEIPSWLKGNLSEDPVGDITKTKEEPKKEEVKTEEAKVETKVDTKAKEVKTETKTETKVEDAGVPDWLKGSFEEETKEEPKKEEVKAEETKEETKSKEVKTETKTETKVDDAGVPDWLKGSFEEETKEEPKKEEVKAEETKVDTKSKEVKTETKTETKVEDAGVPDWLKGSFEEETKEEPKKEEVKAEETKEETKSKEVKTETKTETKVDDAGVPDWLKGSFEEETKEEPKKEEPKLDTKEELDDFTKLDEPVKKANKSKVEDENIPDWLKGSFEEDSKKDKAKVVETKNESKEDTEVKKVNNTKKIETKKSENQTNKNASEKVNQNKTDKKNTNESEVKKTNNTKKTTQRQSNNRSNQNLKAKQTSEGKKEVTNANKKVEVKKAVRKTTEIKNEQKKEEVVKKTETKKIPETKKVTEKTNVKTDNKETKKSDNNGGSELWDDGMKVPEWLKTEDDK